MSHHKNNWSIEIPKLKAEGKTYQEIMKILGCQRSSIAYHANPKFKQRRLITAIKYRKLNPIASKIHTFYYRPKNQPNIPPKFDRAVWYILDVRLTSFSKDRGYSMTKNQRKFKVQDILDKFGEKTNCYLTGQPIDLSHPEEYQFDHILPKSKGGDNSINNLGICTKAANMAKHDLSFLEFIQLCKSVLQHNGYDVIKKEE